MRKILAFYPVSNSATADRNHFDSMNPEEAYSVLKSMPEARLYDLTRNDRTGQMPDIRILLKTIMTKSLTVAGGL